MNGKEADFIIVDEPIINVDYGLMEQAIMAKLVTSKGSLEFKPEFGEPVKDRYQEYADRHGITREEAKSKMFAEDYGNRPTGVKDWKKDLRKLFQPKNG